MSALKPLGRPVVTSKRTPGVPGVPAREAPPPDAFTSGDKPSKAAVLSAQLARQTENLRLFREVFPEGTKPRSGVQVMFVSFKGDDRFVTKKLNAAAGNSLVKSDWAPRLERLLKELDGTVHGGYRVKLLEHFYGMASLALVPEGEAQGSDEAAAELAAQLLGGAAGELGAFLEGARSGWAARATPEAEHQVELLDGLLSELKAKAPALVSHGLTEVRFDARKGGPVFTLMSAVFRSRAAAMLEQLVRDGGSERFDSAALVRALKNPDGFAGALKRLESATVTFGALTLPVVATDAVGGSHGLNPEVLKLLRANVSLEAAPGVLDDLDTVVHQAALLDFVSFDSNRQLATGGTAELERAARVQSMLSVEPRSRTALATAKALLSPEKGGVQVAQSGTPSEQAFFDGLAKHRHTVFFSADIKALGATAQAAMVRQAAQLSKLGGAVQADDIFYRALAANDEVVARKAAVFGPVEQRLREVANGQTLSLLAFGDEVVFALSDWSPESVAQALAAVGASEGSRLVVTETRAVDGETKAQARGRLEAAMGSADRGNETLKSLERRRELLRYQLLALPEPQRTLRLAQLAQASVSNVVARVAEAGVTLVDTRSGALVTADQLEAELEALRAG